MALITKDDVKKELHLQDTERDELIEALVTAVLLLLDEKTDRTWESGTFTEYYDGGTDLLMLKNFPVASITSVHDDPDRAWGSDTLVAAEDYTTDLDLGILFSDSPFYSGKRTVRVIYVAGYAAATFPFKQILIRQVGVWYEQAKDQNWHVSSLALPGGAGTMSYKILEGGFLPEFKLLLEQEQR